MNDDDNDDNNSNNNDNDNSDTCVHNTQYHTNIKMLFNNDSCICTVVAAGPRENIKCSAT